MVEFTLCLTLPGLIFLSNSPGAAAFSCLKTSRLMPFPQTPSATRSSQLDIHPQSRSKTEFLMPRDATQACQMLDMCPHISKQHSLHQRAGDEHENLSLSHPASPCPSSFLLWASFLHCHPEQSPLFQAAPSFMDQPHQSLQQGLRPELMSLLIWDIFPSTRILQKLISLTVVVMGTLFSAGLNQPQ